MAAVLNLSGSPRCQSHNGVVVPKACCTSYVYTGLKLQSTAVAGIFGSKYPNVTFEFYQKVHMSLQTRTSSKATRPVIKMMPIGTPRVPIRAPGDRTSQWVDIWNALYRERIIFIAQKIDEEVGNRILATMLYLDSLESSKMLNLFINGLGGDVTPCMAIFDTMLSLKSPVGTLCMSHAYNLAGFLVAAGDKGKRLAMPLSSIALESPAGAARGQADDIQNEAKELLRIRDYLFKELSRKTGQPVEKIHKDLRTLRYFTAEEAIEYGLIDRLTRTDLIKEDATEVGTGPVDVLLNEPGTDVGDNPYL